MKTELGKLVVTASDSEVVATIAGHNKSVEYNGLEQSVEGYDFVEASSKLYGEGDFASAERPLPRARMSAPTR